MFFKPEIINALKFLCIDAVQQANSGHPGMPLGMAELATILWLKHLKYNALDPNWLNRDRFILSNGHGSMLLYSLLYLTGYDLTIDDLKNFRQLHSKTPGHPEYRITSGVETSTGPLGQGLANAVGMALTEKLLAARFNKQNYDVIDHHTYCFVGDGCLMEGISHEVCSLAGLWGLHKLIVIYDCNNISIDGHTDDWLNDDIVKRFESYNWNVVGPIDGHNQQQIDFALIKAFNSKNKPTIIIANTIIGHGSPNFADTHKVHGSPLGANEIELMRDNLDWHYPPFEIPDPITKVWRENFENKDKYNDWQRLIEQYSSNFPFDSIELDRRNSGKLPEDWDNIIKLISDNLKSNQPLATRQSSQLILDELAKYIPELIGSSADLTGSNLTKFKGAISLSAPDFIGNYIHFGVREFGMVAILNGISVHGGFKVYGGTFLVFSDYCRNAIRMAALMEISVIFVLTHDSIGLGEDGPTHQPIEQLNSLRLIPHLQVWRPADLNETLYAWKNALEYKGPSVLALSRQTVNYSSDLHLEINQGGYIIKKATKPQNSNITIIATGTELDIALLTSELLAKEDINCQVVSMPCVELFEIQPLEYKHLVIPKNDYVFVIEAGTTNYWYKYINNQKGIVFGIDRFGLSAPAKQIYQHFGLNAPTIATKIKEYIKN